MAIELPGEVVQFLQFIGVNWPNVNEDAVRELASHVREFAQSVEGTHQEASSTVQRLGEAYQGASYEALVAKWADLSGSHMTALVDACHVVATALDAAADVIVGMKVEAIAELVVMAAAFIADQAAAVATFGIAEAAVALIIKGAEKLVDFLEQQLVQYVIGQVIEAAIKPLVSVVEQAVGGLMFNATAAILGVPAGGASAVGDSFMVHPDMLANHAQTMHGHAETIAGHAQAFTSKLGTVSFQ
jgi:uncharacterized protein YukE